MMADIPSGATLCIPAISAKLDDKGKLTDPATVSALQFLLNTLIYSLNK
jgi:chromate reductase, NAD(P)H dehydrogenase (quinone)